MQVWTIIDSATGKVVYPAYKTEDDKHPVDDGFVALPTHEFIPLDGDVDPASNVWKNGEWVPNTEFLKSKQRETINAEWLQQENGGFLSSIGMVATDPVSRDRINSLAIKALISNWNDTPFTLSFKKLDDTYHDFTTADEFLAFATEVSDHVISCHVEANQRKSAL